MNRKLFFFFTTLLSFCLSFKIDAQKSGKPIKVETEFDKHFNKAEIYYKSGDYFRAKNLYEYCSNMPHSRSFEAKKKKDISLALMESKHTAERHIREGKDFEAKKVYYTILQANPNDIAIQNILDNSNKPSSSSVITTKSTVNIASVTPKPRATAPKKPISVEKFLIDEFTKKKIEEQKKREDSNSLFESLYAKGIYALNNCEYDKALIHFEKAHKMRPGATKTKKYYYDLQALVVYNNRLEELKKSNNFTSNDVLAIYKKIERLNADFEITQLNSSCKKVKQEIASYIQSEIPTNANQFSCEKIYSFKAVLDSYEVSTAEKEKLQGLITTCETLTNVCNTSNKLIADRIKEAIRLHNEGFTDASNSSLNAVLSEIEKIKTDCKDFDASVFASQINEYKQKNDKLITLKDCQDKQQIKFETGGNLSDKQYYENALVAYNSIDTTCINNTFKESLAEQKIKIGLKMLSIYEDSASRSKSLGYFKDEALFLDKAYAFAKNKTDSVRIENKYKLNKCVQENGGKCPEKEVKNIAGMVTCKDTTQKQTKIQILFGINTGTPKIAIFIPTILIESTRQSGKYSPSPFIGLGINRQSFRKKIDYSADIFYTIPYDISFLSSTNRLSEISFHSFDSDLKIKFHKIKVCPTMGRSYVFLGVNSGYKKIHKSGSDLLASDTYLRNNYGNAIHLGYLAGLGYEFPKDKLSFEIGYKRQSLFYANKNVYSPFKAPFSLGLLSIKLGFAVN